MKKSIKAAPYSLNNITPVGTSFYMDASYLYRPGLAKDLLDSSGSKCLESFYVSGTLKKTFLKLVDLFIGHGGKKTISSDNGCVFWWEDAYSAISFNKKTNAVSVSLETLNPKLLELRVILEKSWITKATRSCVFTIVQSNGGLAIQNIGNGHSPLFEENYSPEVIKDYRFVINSFKKSPPNGRVAILNGIPGSGKTHLCRSLLSELDVTFIIVPSNLISSMEKPDFLPILLRAKNDYERPIVMIIEDGDICLVPRKGDNMSTIAALLNLSDGILGSLIDIKMVITTNADIKEMDDAVMRPGRLCRQIHVGPLEMDQANKVYQRILKDGSRTLAPSKSGYTLAEIYHAANEVNDPATVINRRSKDSKRVIGFFHQPISSDPFVYGSDVSEKDLTINEAILRFEK